jgi:hypothetical protein
MRVTLEQCLFGLYFQVFEKKKIYYIQTQLCSKSLIVHNVSAHTDYKLNNIGAVFCAL